MMTTTNDRRWFAVVARSEPPLLRRFFHALSLSQRKLSHLFVFHLPLSLSLSLSLSNTSRSRRLPTCFQTVVSVPLLGNCGVLVGWLCCPVIPTVLRVHTSTLSDQSPTVTEAPLDLQRSTRVASLPFVSDVHHLDDAPSFADEHLHRTSTFERCFAGCSGLQVRCKSRFYRC
jgi:hypothetical protein